MPVAALIWAPAESVTDSPRAPRRPLRPAVACRATVRDMAEIIPQRELRNNNAAIVDRVARGQTFVVTRHGRPVAELRPVGQGRGRLVRREELAQTAARAGHIDATAFRADLDGLMDPGIDR